MSAEERLDTRYENSAAWATGQAFIEDSSSGPGAETIRRVWEDVAA